jgi:1-acyl-sn-glycerol-3-phosphate acyltransferase
MIYLAGAKHCLLVGAMSNFRLALIKPFLQFLHDICWHVQTEGLEQLPEQGPVFIVGNTNGHMPWPALILAYALMMKANGKQRRVNVLTDIDTIVDEKIYPFLQSLNFVPWSYDNAKHLLEQGELVIVFPEDRSNIGKTAAMRNRLKRFDWTKFLPAIETGVPIHPIATLGVDGVNPLSAAWKMRLIRALPYDHVQEREPLQDEAKKVALFAEGEIQAEINRLLRARSRK